MLPALITKPKQAVRQVNSLTNDSIDSYANMPFGSNSSTDTRVGVTYVDNTEAGSGTARASPLASSRAAMKPKCALVSKTASDEDEITMARVLRDRIASGEEELSLRTGDIVTVLSAKRTGYLKCEAGDKVGYVPSSYLEFLDSGTEVESGTIVRNKTNEEAQQAVEKQRKKQRQKEKRRKEKQDSQLAVENHTAVAVAGNEINERPHKRKKKPRQTRESDVEDGFYRDKAEEGRLSTRYRAAPVDMDRSHSKSKHSKKKRHHGLTSSESSGSNGGKRSGRHGRHRRRRRAESDSESEFTSSDDSAESNRRRRRRHRHRHRRTSSDDDDENDSDYKSHARRSKNCRDKKNVEVEPEEGTRVARKAEKKKVTEALLKVEKGVSQLEIEAKGDVCGTKETAIPSQKEELNRDKGNKEGKERGENLSTAAVASSHRKDDEFQSSSSAVPLSKQNKPGLGRQIGDKMRSFLGGGNKKSHNSSKSSGILNACPGTVQGEEGWYEHGENERYYFVLVNGKWSLLYGPMIEDDFERFSNRVTAQMRSIELPPTYLHKSGYFLNCELRVQKEL